MHKVVFVSKTQDDTESLIKLIMSIADIKKVHNKMYENTQDQVKYIFLNLEKSSVYDLRGVTINTLYFVMGMKEIPRIWMESIYPQMVSTPNANIIACEQFNINRFFK